MNDIQKPPQDAGPISALIQTLPQENIPQLRLNRIELMRRIQLIRGRELIVYAVRGDIAIPGVPSLMHPNDIMPLSEIVDSVKSDDIDILLETPGGIAEVTVDIMRLLRPRFKRVAFIVPNRAMSAGTILAMHGDEILMDHRSALGPIDPQFLGNDGRLVAAQAILTGIDTLKSKVDQEKGILHPVYAAI